MSYDGEESGLSMPAMTKGCIVAGRNICHDEMPTVHTGIATYATIAYKALGFEDETEEYHGSGAQHTT